MRSPSATFFDDTVDAIPTETNFEDLGAISRFDALSRGFVSSWSTGHNWRQVIAKQLDGLTDEQQAAIAELAGAKQAGFDTKFLQDLDEVK